MKFSVNKRVNATSTLDFKVDFQIGYTFLTSNDRNMQQVYCIQVLVNTKINSHNFSLRYFHMKKFRRTSSLKTCLHEKV